MKKILITAGLVCMLSGCIGEENSPKIEFTGGSSITVLLGEKFVEPGYKATDKEDGDVTEKVTVSGWDGDTSKEGTYKRVYSVIDSDGNTEEKSREIVIKKISNVEKYSNGIVKYAKEGLSDGSIIEYEKYENGEMKSFKRYKNQKIVEECVYGTNGLSTASKYYNTRTENGLSIDIVYEYDYDANGKTVESRMKKNGVLTKVGSYSEDIKTKDVVYKDGKVIKEIEYYTDTQIKKYKVYDDSGVIIFNEEYAKEDFTGKTEKEIGEILLSYGYDFENNVELPGIKQEIFSNSYNGSDYYTISNWESFITKNYASINERVFENINYEKIAEDKFIRKIIDDDMFRKINEEVRGIADTFIEIDINKFYLSDVYKGIEYIDSYKNIETEKTKYKENFKIIYGEYKMQEVIFGVSCYIIKQINNLPEDEKLRKKYIEIGKKVINNIESETKIDISKEENKIVQKLDINIMIFATEAAEMGIKVKTYLELTQAIEKVEKFANINQSNRKKMKSKIYKLESTEN